MPPWLCWNIQELLALEDRIGNVSTGLTAEAVADKLKTSYYSSLNMAVARFSQEYDIKCSICQVHRNLVCQVFLNNLEVLLFVTC